LACEVQIVRDRLDDEVGSRNRFFQFSGLGEIRVGCGDGVVIGRVQLLLHLLANSFEALLSCGERLFVDVIRDDLFSCECGNESDLGTQDTSAENSYIIDCHVADVTLFLRAMPRHSAPTRSNSWRSRTSTFARCSNEATV